MRSRPTFAAVSLVGVLVIVAGCSSSSTDASATSTTTTIAIGSSTTEPRATTSTLHSTRPRANLDFRAVEGDPTRMATPTSKCAGVPDRGRRNCYVLGPTLLTGAGIDTASVVYDSNLSEWVVDVHWDNNDFITKVARPLVNQQFAIVLDGVVQSALIVNEGITGRDVEIASRYTESDAVGIAASILGVTPAQIRAEMPEN